MKKTNLFISLTLILALLIAGCQESIKTSPISGGKSAETQFSSKYDPYDNLKPTSFKSEEEYIRFLKSYENSGEIYYGGIGIRRDVMMQTTAMTMDSSLKGVTPSVAAGSQNDFSGTNVQVEGVDEGDILKTDGEYIYTITGKTLFIIKAYPGEDAEVVSTINFEFQPTGLFVEGNKLAVFGSSYNSKWMLEKGIRARSGTTSLELYDISSKQNPKKTKEFAFEGSYSHSRMIDGNVYIVNTLYPEYRVDYPTPIIMDGGLVRSMPVDRIHYFNIPYWNPSFVAVYSINLNTEQNVDSRMLTIEGYPSIYMSQDNLFITYTENINEWELQQETLKELIEPKLPEIYRNIIRKIQATDIDVLSKPEKEQKIMQIYYEYVESLTQNEQDDLQDKVEELLEAKLKRYEYFEFTVINKLKVDSGKIELAGDGKAPGRILNQFSMDEHKDVFRIATTISARWSRFGKSMTESTNNVYTLDSNLNLIGKLEGLAEGESIFSARFMGDRLYIVTFRQVDPFFAIDLSNPKSPKMLGELKIPGFSRYLHPYDENIIIGIGRDATETGRQQGIKISLFDVSDVSNPKEIAKFVSDDRYSGSAAEWEHKAFLFSKEKELLVIPIYNYDWQTPSNNYNGALVFNIKRNDISLRGLIDHSKGSEQYEQGVERSLYINELLYTKSPTLLRINEILDLGSVKDVALNAKYLGEIPVY